MKTEKTIARNEGHILRRYVGNGLALPFSMIALSEFFLLISATTMAPDAITTAAIIVAAGWSIVIAILLMFPTSYSADLYIHPRLTRVVDVFFTNKFRTFGFLPSEMLVMYQYLFQ